MPIHCNVLTEHLQQVGRLVAAWNREGREVPRGFQGSLRDYAWACLCINLEDDLVTFEDVYESPPHRNGGEQSKEPVPYPPTPSQTVYARHYWNARLQRWLPVD